MKIRFFIYELWRQTIRGNILIIWIGWISMNWSSFNNYLYHFFRKTLREVVRLMISFRSHVRRRSARVRFNQGLVTWGYYYFVSTVSLDNCLEISKDCKILRKLSNWLSSVSSSSFQYCSLATLAPQILVLTQRRSLLQLDCVNR